jgi:hypothetical protein
MIVLLLTWVALADEPVIQYVPPGQTVQAEVSSYLLPEAKYDRCLLAVRELKIVDGALAKCLIGSDEVLAEAEVALAVVRERVVADASEIARLGAVLEVKDQRIVDLRRQRNTAYLVTGGTLAVVITTLGLAVAL